MDQLQSIPDVLSKHKKQSESLFKRIQEAAEGIGAGALYRFSDNDIMIFFKIKTEEQNKKVHHLYKEMSEKLPFAKCRYSVMSDEYHNYMKIADQKILSAKRMEAYMELADYNKVSSIGLRRSKRFEPRVMIVEDDRFTAAYTSNLLNKDFEVIHARNGEEGIKYYIEYAPDTVFLDIHLPGLTGHQTLKAIKAADKKAFIIMMSVDTIRENVISACRLGAQSFLKKPFNKERLLKVAKKSPFLHTQNESSELLGA